MEKFVTIAVFQYPAEAYVQKAKLEAYDIPAFLRDEFTVQSYNFLSNAIGGVKLQVMESDVDKAKDLLGDTGSIVDEEMVVLDSSSSDNAVKRGTNLLTIFMMVLLLLALTILWYF